MYEMYIYTNGVPYYMSKMANFLDPQKEYFGSSKIISKFKKFRGQRKNLDLVTVDESCTIILDDKENVWEDKSMDNLIVMKKYDFFASKLESIFDPNLKSYTQLKSDESETDGVLAAILAVLRQIHNMYVMYNSNEADDDRRILKTIRKQVLTECKLVFSSFENDQYFFDMADQLGATCTTKLDPLATHVVSTSTQTNISRWAVEDKKILVHPWWIRAENFMWKKQEEEQDFFPESWVTYGFNYIDKKIIKSEEIAQGRKILMENFVQSRKKICLVLDLNHILLNTTRIQDIKASEDEYLKSKTAPENNFNLFMYELGNKEGL